MKNIASRFKTLLPMILRWVMGWHFLYEGFSKLFNPQWTSRGFLVNSQGPFAPVFQSMVDSINISILDFYYN